MADIKIYRICALLLGIFTALIGFFSTIGGLAGFAFKGRIREAIANYNPAWVSGWDKWGGTVLGGVFVFGIIALLLGVGTLLYVQKRGKEE